MNEDMERHTVDPRASRGGWRRLWLLATIGAAVVVGLVWIVATRGDGDSAGGAAKSGDKGGMEGMAGMEGMPGMEGMAGMAMSSDGSVRLAAGQIAEFGITFGTVEMRTLEHTIRAPGVVAFDETRVTMVAVRFGGFVERLHVNSTGQPVQAGQPLLDVYSPELVAAQEELLVARRLEQTMNESAVPGVPAGSSDLVGAARRRLRLWDITDAQIDGILRAGEVRRALTLYAPASGVVVEKNVLAGQAIQSGHALYTIADLSEVWVEVELRENEAEGVREGSTAEIEFTAYAGRPLKGSVAYVYPTLQAESRTLKARIVVSNGDAAGRLRPGMFATVRIISPGRRALTVPSSAVIRTGERTLVFVDMGGGMLIPHEIKTGATGDDHVEVLSGVEPGQRIVTSAQFLLDSESNLGEVMQSMIGMGR